jgi:hypothetical protein
MAKGTTKKSAGAKRPLRRPAAATTGGRARKTPAAAAPRARLARSRADSRASARPASASDGAPRLDPVAFDGEATTIDGQPFDLGELAGC